jgi:cell division protein FtsQ
LEINKDGRTLYFSDEELDNETTGEKKVFVTKRINGKESHVKASKIKKENKRDIKKENERKEKFNFNDEIVIGVNFIKPAKNEEEEKIKNKKNKKKKKKNKYNVKLITFVSCFLLVIASVIFALTAPIFNIAKIEVTGNSKVQEENIKSLSRLKIGENIFKFNSSVISNIKENAYIENVEVKRALPDTVKIEVTEREVKYQINLINSYVYIDKYGYILENSAEKKAVPTIVGLKITEDDLMKKTRLEGKDIETLNKILKITEAAKIINIDNIITEINTENDTDYVLYIESEAKTIYIGDTTNLTNKMLYIQKILQNEKGKSGKVFVNKDMTTGFKPYFREE